MGGRNVAKSKRLEEMQEGVQEVPKMNGGNITLIQEAERTK